MSSTPWGFPLPWLTFLKSRVSDGSTRRFRFRLSSWADWFIQCGFTNQRERIFKESFGLYGGSGLGRAESGGEAATLVQRRRKMKFLIVCIVFAAGFTAAAAHAQFGASWRRTPTIAVVGPEGDPRLALVDEAVAFWNKTLEELGSGFRLGAVTRLVRPVPEEDLRSVGESVLAGHRGTVRVPRAFH